MNYKYLLSKTPLIGVSTAISPVLGSLVFGKLLSDVLGENRNYELNKKIFAPDGEEYSKSENQLRNKFGLTIIPCAVVGLIAHMGLLVYYQSDFKNYTYLHNSDGISVRQRDSVSLMGN
ncbi:MAG: hypothetical protein HRU03_09115, partial [Nanoarchaeales archaeon]|nr:hypothetical protein [Nanoarchaeales archaeon]